MSALVRWGWIGATPCAGWRMGQLHSRGYIVARTEGEAMAQVQVQVQVEVEVEVQVEVERREGHGSRGDGVARG
jgi:hypothetical protein